MTLHGFTSIGKTVRTIAEEVCDGKTVDLLASGYNQRVLPYAWSALLSGLLDLDLDVSDMEEQDAPPEDSRCEDTKKMVKELKRTLTKYWRGMGNR